MTESAYLPLASLAVAALAVIVGPWVSWRIARRQIATAMHVAHKQVIAPMRQAWIDSLRDRVAEILNSSHWFYVAAEGDSPLPADSNEEEFERAGSVVDKKLLFLTRQIELMLNPDEEDHQLLRKRLSEVVESALGRGKVWDRFPQRCEAATAQCQKVLKREWERLKRETDPT
jgi:hypothetical protein